MYAKTGLSVIAAAGVAVGVVGMTMGGASGSPASCVPANGAGASNGARSSSAAVRANDASRSASDANGSNAAGVDGAGVADPNGTGSSTTPAGIVDNTTGNVTNPDPTIVAGANGSDPSAASDGPSSSQSDRPLLDATGRTSQQGIAGVTAPPSGTSVIGRSSNISGVHIFAHANH